MTIPLVCQENTPSSIRSQYSTARFRLPSKIIWRTEAVLESNYDDVGSIYERRWRGIPPYGLIFLLPVKREQSTQERPFEEARRNRILPPPDPEKLRVNVYFVRGRPAASSLAMTKLSIGLRHQDASATFGTAWAWTGRKDQCWRPTPA